MPSMKIPLRLGVILSAALAAGCAFQPTTTPMCDITPPQLEWMETDRPDLVILTDKGQAELLNWINDTQECLTGVQ